MARTTTSQKFGKRVKEFRLRAKLSQEELGDATKFSQTQISNIETGAGNPSLKTIDTIAIALDTTISELTKFKSSDGKYKLTEQSRNSN